MPTFRKTLTLLMGILGIAGEQRELLPANQQTFRTVLERRSTYAKLAPERHVDFARFFGEGQTYGIDIRRVSVGQVDMPTGELVVADPFYFTADFTHPFIRSVPPGQYPLEVAIGSFGAWQERVAFARLRFSERKVVRWEVAKTEDASPLNVFFGVDAGLAAFSGVPAASRFAEAQREFERLHPDGNYYDDVMSRDLPASANWGVHHLSDRTAVCIISSGLGDGLYSSYWGLDESGNPAQLVTDFQLFDFEGPVMRR